MINQIRKKENLLRLVFMIVMVIMLVPFFGMKKETQAAQAFEITAPANNGLIGAGRNRDLLKLTLSQKSDSRALIIKVAMAKL